MFSYLTWWDELLERKRKGIYIFVLRLNKVVLKYKETENTWERSLFIFFRDVYFKNCSFILLYEATKELLKWKDRSSLFAVRKIICFVYSKSVEFIYYVYIFVKFIQDTCDSYIYTNWASLDAIAVSILFCFPPHFEGERDTASSV